MNGSTVVASATVNAVNGIADFTGSGLFTPVNTAVSIVFESAGLQSASQGIQPMIRPISIDIVPDSTRLSSTPGTWIDGDFFAAPGSRVAALRVSDVLAKLNAGLQVNLIAETGNVNINENLVSANTAGSLLLSAGNDVNVNRNVVVSGPTSSVVVRANRDLIMVRGASNNDRIRIHSNNGTLALWSDADSNNQGAVFMRNHTELRSNGGDIYVAGGASTVSKGVSVPAGFAAGYNGTYFTGVQLGEWNLRDQVRIVSGGGDIVIRGTSNQSNGLLGHAGNYVHSGTGQITLAGNSFGTASVIPLRLNQSGGNVMGSFFISEATVSPAIRMIVNNDTTASTWGLYLNEGGPLNTLTTQAAIEQNGGSSWSPSAASIAANRMLNIWGKGGIDVNVRQRTYAHGVYMGANFLAETGEVKIDTGNKNIYFTGTTNPPTYLGAMPSSVITSSSASIRLQALNVENEQWASLLTRGDISLDPGINADFGGDVYFPRSETAIGNAINTPSGFRIGRAQPGTGDGFGFFGNRRIEVNRSFNVNGPVELYGGNVVHYQTISASGPVTISSEVSSWPYGNILVSGENNAIRILAEDSIYTNTAQNFYTNGGDIVFGSNADNTGNGVIRFAAGTKLNTANGALNLPGFNFGRGNIYLAGANQMTNGYPTGYAEAIDGGAHAIQFYGNNATTQLVSGGGDIYVKGRGSGTGANTFGIFLAGGYIDSGNGVVRLDGVGRNSNNAGITLEASAGEKLRIYAAGGSAETTSPAIELRGTVDHISSRRPVSFGWAASTINDQLLEARGAGGISILASRTPSTATSEWNLRLNGASLLSRTGPIYINTGAGNGGVNMYSEAGYYAGAAFGAATSSSIARQRWGSSTMMLGATITTSSADVIIETDYLYSDNENRFVVQTSGDVSITPVSADFRSEPYVYSAMFGIGELTVGKDGQRTQDVRVLGEFYGTGPFNIYGRMIQHW
jgi:hypothetical protein